jgi:hypothetical protein
MESSETDLRTGFSFSVKTLFQRFTRVIAVRDRVAVVSQHASLDCVVFVDFTFVSTFPFLRARPHRTFHKSNFRNFIAKTCLFSRSLWRMFLFCNSSESAFPAFVPFAIVLRWSDGLFGKTEKGKREIS